MKLSELKAKNPTWFSKSNRRFFGDVQYKILKGKKTKTFYLVRLTSGFSDMFSNTKTYSWRLNEIKDNYEIGDLLDIKFRDNDYEYLKEYMKKL